ncbi:MAG: 1,4-beta-xylanase [Chitinophagales bacterium]
MANMKFFAFTLIIFLAGFSCNAQNNDARWSKEKVKDWYNAYPWLRGCNFIPSTAVNQLEMWQAETFDSATIDKELQLAEETGFNCMRVFLHHVAWQVDPVGFKARVNTNLDIAHKHGIVTMFVFFDDCWNATYHSGVQPAPKPGIHNSQWVRDPGKLIYEERDSLYPVLEAYVKDILSTYKNDKRILLWDLYNEPGNSGNGPRTLPLLKKVFTWAREVQPQQPVTAGVFLKLFGRLSSFQLKHSDVISYHCYFGSKQHLARIKQLKRFDRPLICTEYMARTMNSTFQNIMPLLKQQGVGAINWGLVAGKTNTIYAWLTPMPNGSEPKLWFHDIFKKDGTPYKEEEVRFIKSLTGK